jgi:hypothetical protein
VSFLHAIPRIEDPLDNESLVYRDEDLRAHATHSVALDGHGLLVVSEREYWAEFAVLAFYCAEDEACAKNVCWQRVFEGSGTTGALRELRHTWWGEPDNAGYIFYPSPLLITSAFRELARWFDEP